MLTGTPLALTPFGALIKGLGHFYWLLALCIVLLALCVIDGGAANDSIYVGNKGRTA